MTSIIKKTWLLAGIYAVGNLLLSVGQLAIAPLLTRRLSIAQYGTYEILIVTYIAVRTLLILPLSSALVYGYCKYCQTDNDRSGLLGTACLLSLCISIVFILTGFLIPQWPSWFIFSQDNLKTIGFLILCSLAFETFIQIALGALRAAQQPVFFVLIALTQLLGTLFMTGVIVGYYKWGTEGVFASIFIGNILTYIVMIPIMWNRVSGKFNWIHIKPVMIFAMTLVPTTLANLILSISDRYFINSFWDLTTVGVYGLTYKIGSGVSMLIAMPFVTAWPALIFSEKDSNKIGEFVSKAAFSLWMIGMFFVVIGSTSAKPLLLLFGGNRFLPGANLIPLISLGGLLFGVTGLIMTSIVATGLLHWNMITMLAVSGVNLIFNILLIPTYGMIGAALSTIFSYTVGFFISIVLAQKIIPLKVDILKWTKIIVGGLIALFCGRLFTEISHYQMLNIFAATSIAAGVYVLSLTLFRLLPAAFYDPALIRRGCFSFIRSNKTSNNDSL